MSNCRSRPTAVGVFICLLISSRAFADGAVVDKIYAPYVIALEKEIEYRLVVQNDATERPDGQQIHRLGYGVSWSDRWFSEFYVIGIKPKSDNLSIEGYEVETRWQITEQGEYWADWGLLFELEWLPNDALEYGTTLLVSKEWRRWIATANVGLIYEWIDDVASEWETSLSIQTRYRLTRGFEPTLEFYSGQDTRAVGPVAVGNIRVAGRNKLHWELGLIFGIDKASPDQTFRGLLEFEF